MLRVRERVELLRERDAVLRLAVLRGFAAAVERLAGASRAAVARDLVALELARDFVVVDFARDVLLRAAGFLRALLRDEAVDAALALDPSSLLHLPDITRCAASATASAMIDPNFVALAIMLLAALEAVSAASSPASRILRRAAGLALIAAAAAARPAASISLLIAAFVILSIVVSFEEEPEDDLEDREELLRAGLAIAFLPPLRRKTL